MRQGQGGGVGLPPETLLPTAPQGVGLKGPLPSGPPSPGRSGHGPRDHPPAPPHSPPLGGSVPLQPGRRASPSTLSQQAGLRL